MLINKISAGEKSTNRPTIRSSSPTKVLKVTVVERPKKGAQPLSLLALVLSLATNFGWLDDQFWPINMRINRN